MARPHLVTIASVEMCDGSTLFCARELVFELQLCTESS